MPSPMSERHAPLTASAGIGLKPQHAADLLDRHAVGFFEVHAENYMGAGGPPHALLRRVRESFPLSLHGVGLSIGGAGPLCKEHLRRLKRLIERYEPALFSEHLAWSSHGAAFLNDLLPVPYNVETLDRVCDHVDHVQATLRTRMLLENPSTYVVFENSTMSEPDFLREVAAADCCSTSAISAFLPSITILSRWPDCPRPRLSRGGRCARGNAGVCSFASGTACRSALRFSSIDLDRQVPISNCVDLESER